MEELEKRIFDLIKKKSAGVDELFDILEINEIDKQNEVKSILKKMELLGYIYLNNNHKYIPFPHEKKLRVTKIKIEDDEIVAKGIRNLVFTADDQERLMDKDIVIVRLTNKGKNNAQYGVVDRILSREKQMIRFSVENVNGELKFYNKRFGYEKINTSKKLYEDDIVLLKANYDEDFFVESFEFVERVGTRFDQDIDIREIIIENECKIEFPDDVIEEVESLAESVSLEGRTDFTDKKVVTIDCDDTKDMDDAIHLEELPDGCTKLFVHIADVTKFVKYGSHLCLEAFDRGTSIYAPHFVDPMFPKRLSNDLCSLNPNTFRYTLTAEMLLDQKGKTIDFKLHKGVINSRMKMSYSKVNEALLGNPSAEYVPYLDELEKMSKLSDKLERLKSLRGALDFNLREVNIDVDDEGKVLDISNKKRGKAEHIIENFMLTANESVAKYLKENDIPLINRFHDHPDKEKIMSLLAVLSDSGIKFKHNKNVTDSKVFRGFLNTLKSQENGDVISMSFLESLKRAGYSVENSGHFGLALDDYCHFTSPIRRLADLTVHYQLKALMGEMECIDFEELKLLATVASSKERVADKIELEADKLEMVKYMQNYIGDVFEGVISRIDKNGISIILENGVIGKVTYANMQDDFYKFDPVTLTISSKRNKTTYKLGKFVPVRVVGVDIYERRIDFAIGPKITKGKMLTLSKGERQII